MIAQSSLDDLKALLEKTLEVELAQQERFTKIANFADTIILRLAERPEGISVPVPNARKVLELLTSIHPPQLEFIRMLRLLLVLFPHLSDWIKIQREGI